MVIVIVADSMSNSPITLFIILFSLLALLPFAALAFHGLPTDTSHNYLVPNTCGSLDACTICDIFILVQSVYNFLIWFMAMPLAALMLAFGGVLLTLPYFGASQKMHDWGKAVLTQAVVGVLIVFVAWLAVDTIIKVVAGATATTSTGETVGGLFPDYKLGPWNEIKCEAPEIKVTTPTQTTKGSTSYQCSGTGATGQIFTGNDALKNCRANCPNGSCRPISTGNGENGSGNGTLPPGTLTHEAATEKIKAEDMLICATEGGCENPCADPNNKNCTYLGGMPESLISELTLMQNEMREIFDCSSCVFRVNGYSETGHATHGAGKNIIDIDNNESSSDKVDEYFMSRANKAGQKPANDIWYQDKSKLSKYYLYEGNHWHVCLNTTDCQEAVGGD